MWAAGSIEDMRSMYQNQGRQTEAGVWSILLTPTMSDAAEFADRYFEYFNDLSRGVWHLKVFAERCPETGAWRANEDLFKRSEAIRSSLEKIVDNLPPMCIVFLSANKPEDDMPSEAPVQTWAVLPLDETKLSNQKLFTSGLQATRVALDECYRDHRIERCTALTQKNTDLVIKSLQTKLYRLATNKKVACFLVNPAKWVVLTVISAILGLPVSALAGGDD